MTPPHAVSGITGIPQRMSTIHSPLDLVVNFEMPAKLTPEDIRKVEKDLELLGKIVRHPRLMNDMYSAIVEGRLAEAVAAGRKLGLQEHRFIAAGGGAAWIPIVAGIMAGVMIIESVAGAFGGGEHADPHVELEGEPTGGEGEGEGEVGGAPE